MTVWTRVKYMCALVLLAPSEPWLPCFGAFYWNCRRIGHPSTFHQPIMCSKGEAPRRVWQRRTRSRGEGGGGGTGGHSVNTWMHTGSCAFMSMQVCIRVCVCVCEARERSVTGHQMLIVWDEPESKKRRGQSPHRVYLSLMHTHTHTQQSDGWYCSRH